MIGSYKDKGTEDVFNDERTKAAAKTCPPQLWKIARRKLNQLNVVTNLNDLRIPPGNRLKELSGNRQGQHSIRINDQYRICFEWSVDKADNVEICDYH